MAAPGFSRGFLSLFSLSFLFCFFHLTLRMRPFTTPGRWPRCPRGRPDRVTRPGPSGRSIRSFVDRVTRSVHSVGPPVRSSGRGQGHPRSRSIWAVPSLGLRSALCIWYMVIVEGVRCMARGTYMVRKTRLGRGAVSGKKSIIYNVKMFRNLILLSGPTPTVSSPREILIWREHEGEEHPRKHPHTAAGHPRKHARGAGTGPGVPRRNGQGRPPGGQGRRWRGGGVPTPHQLTHLRSHQPGTCPIRLPWYERPENDQLLCADGSGGCSRPVAQWSF